MSHQVIARKWRPQSFDQMVGQTHISQTLNNAILLDRIPQALLFTGPRGTGKTSSARIFAKNLRCLNPNYNPNYKVQTDKVQTESRETESSTGESPTDPGASTDTTKVALSGTTGLACNACQSCLEINAGNAVDVLEIDGASHNGVDSVRQLRENVGYMPSYGKYKVYIVDEVHMLSGSAFNALLKTLEEPPAHVVFILATTEVHKIPETILSRCQRFDFRRIPLQQVVDRLQLICDSEGFVSETEALWLLARQGEGSLRDSLSFLDQVAAFSRGQITLAKVVDILGLLDHHLLKSLLHALILRQAPEVLSLLGKLHSSGLDAQIFFSELLFWVRNLIVIKTADGEKPYWLELSDGDFADFAKIAAQTSIEDLHFLFDLLLKGQMDLQRAAQPMMVVEVILLRCLLIPQMSPIQDMLDHHEQTSPRPTPSQMGVRAGAGGGGGTGATGASSANVTSTRNPHFEKNPSSQTRPQPPGQPQAAQPMRRASPRYVSGKTPLEKWFNFAEKTKDVDPLYAAKLENIVFIGDSDKRLTLSVPSKLAFLRDQLLAPESRKKLQGLIDSFWGAGYAFDVGMGQEEKGDSVHSFRQREAQKQSEQILQRVKEHPAVQKAQEVFKTRIASVKEVTSTKDATAAAAAVAAPGANKTQQDG